MNQIADFLLFLFKERKLQPSTIEGYRTAIADMVGNYKLESGLSLSFSYFPLQESVGSRGSFLCGPGSHTGIGPFFRPVP